MANRVPDEIWQDIVEYSPLVSVDLIVEQAGGIVLGQRENRPAKGEWFVPGGVVNKGESLNEAVHRIAREELGNPVTIRTQLGVYEHRYETSEFEGVSKHYIPIAYVVELGSDVIMTDSQHSSFHVFNAPFSGFHENVQTYLDDYEEWKNNVE
ncbi:NUDIX domain-containing protein [Natrinema salinisoli]|uniref:NUDIX domain-containing protein n=1 Tax=Natrinema salinisoli TaxID=2878535 RepID=UPI001CF0B905|nr:NUDIX domain-containing protein [Natrinema salinisoli]